MEPYLPFITDSNSWTIFKPRPWNSSRLIISLLLLSTTVQNLSLTTQPLDSVSHLCVPWFWLSYWLKSRSTLYQSCRNARSEFSLTIAATSRGIKLAVLQLSTYPLETYVKYYLLAAVFFFLSVWSTLNNHIFQQFVRESSFGYSANFGSLVTSSIAFTP